MIAGFGKLCSGEAEAGQTDEVAARYFAVSKVG